MMKRYLFIVGCLLSVLLISCSKTSKPTIDTHSSLSGKWMLIENLADPGDGSGTWTATDKPNYYYLELKADKTIESNLLTGLGGVKKYEIINDSMINFLYANGIEIKNHYKLGPSTLTLTGGCIEACGSKFIKSKQ